MAENKNKVSGNLFDFKIIKRLMVFCKPYMKFFYFLVFLTLSLSLLQPLRPFITQIIIDDYVSIGDSDGLLKMIMLLLFLLVINGRNKSFVASFTPTIFSILDNSIIVSIVISTIDLPGIL